MLAAIFSVVLCQCPPETARQWPLAAGGNGHWFATMVNRTPLSWTDARTVAIGMGGDLASLPTQEANVWAWQNVVPQGEAVYLGGWQLPGSCEPGCGWTWASGAPWGFAAWLPPDPNDAGGQEHFLQYAPFVGLPVWQDVADDGSGQAITAFLVEWHSPCLPCGADLNGDGVVNGADLAYVLAFWNLTGPADLDASGTVDGADLGLVLSAWGPCPG